MPKSKGGRPSVWGSRLKRTSVTLAQEHIDFLESVVPDNLSEAIRQIIERMGGPKLRSEPPPALSQYPVDPDRPVYIYALCDPGTANIRYVGKTVNLKTRIAAHMYADNGTKHGMNPCDQWIRELKTQKKRPDVLVLEQTTEAEWQTKEQEWIDKLIKQGVELLNVSAGGHYGQWIKTYKAWDEPPVARKKGTDHES